MPARCPVGETYNQSFKACRPKKKPGRKSSSTEFKNPPIKDWEFSINFILAGKTKRKSPKK